MKTQGERLLFYSSYAFLPQLYSVFEELCARYGLQGHVIAHERAEVPKVYSPSGYLTHESAGLSTVPAFATVIPKDLAVEEKSTLLKRKIQEIKPDFIWAHEEPSDFFVNQILGWFRNDRQPRIIVYLAENIWPNAGGGYRERWAKFRRGRLWSRYDGVRGVRHEISRSNPQLWNACERAYFYRLGAQFAAQKAKRERGQFPFARKTAGRFFCGFCGANYRRQRVACIISGTDTASGEF